MGYNENEWIFKNSYGPDWGEKGYFRVKMGNYFNVCHDFAAYTGNGKQISELDHDRNEYLERTEQEILSICEAETYCY